MAKPFASVTMFAVIFVSLVILVHGRSKMHKSSASNKEVPARRVTVPSSPRNGTGSVHAPSIHTPDIRPRRTSTVKLAKNAQRRERKHIRKSKKRPRKNKQRAKGKQNIESNDIIRETMIHMFGFDHLPSRTNCEGADCLRGSTRSESTERRAESPENNLESPQFKPRPPSFMLELYRTYSQDKDLMILHSKSQGNTVRSFFPSPANPLHRERNFGQAIVIAPVPENGPEFTPTSVFLYNITLIPALEDLVGAEIRLDGLLAESETNVMVGVYERQRECEDEPDCNAGLNEIFTKVGKTLFLNSVSGTTWSDPKLARLAKRARQNQHVVIVKFVTDREHVEAAPSLRLRRHFEKKPDLPQSFISYDGHVTRSKRSSSNLEGGETLSPEPLIPIFIAYCNDPRSSAEAQSVPAAPVIWKALENVTTTRRMRRSASPDRGHNLARDTSDGDTEVATSTDKRTRNAPLRNSIYVVEKRKNGSKRRRKNKSNLQAPRNATLSSHNANDAQNRRQSKKNRNRGRGSRRSGRRNKPRKERTDVKLHPSLLGEENKKSCNRRSLTVSFADIGWSPWIISPEHFEAYYCSGNCDLKQSEETSATNHAIIQSAVKNIAGHSDLPSPCCVPDKLMSLSVLFFDQDKNVVLKVFPDMSVETCGCR